MSLKEELALIDWKEANISVGEHARLSMPGSAMLQNIRAP